MAEYIKRDVVLDYAYEIRPGRCDYFNIGIAEEMVLDSRKEIADDLEKLEYEEISNEHWHDASKELPTPFVSVIGHIAGEDLFPDCRECYVVGEKFFFPALDEFLNVDYWMYFPTMKGE